MCRKEPGMKINRVTLYNFSSYVGENTIALGTHNEQNIILIGGNNGAGKTGISKKSAPCLAMQWRGALFPFFPLYSFITSLMNPSMRWALSCLIRSVKWAYLSRVKAAVAWPKLLWMVFISSPARIALTAYVWRKS